MQTLCLSTPISSTPTQVYCLIRARHSDCRASLPRAPVSPFIVGRRVRDLLLVLTNLGSLDRIVPELHTHNVFLADDYQDSFDDIFKRQQIPKEPSFYLNVPSRVDDSAAPPGKDTTVVLVPCGHLMDGPTQHGLNPQTSQDWNAMVSKARRAVVQTVQQRTGVDLTSMIVRETVNTPDSWKEKFNLDKGAILGLSHSFFNVLSFRPKTKHASINNLYFVGASTHPGTGVPIVLAGSKITTGQILDDLGIVNPWSSGAHERRVVSSLDKEGQIPFDLVSSLGILVLALLMMVAFFLAPFNLGK